MKPHWAPSLFLLIGVLHADSVTTPPLGFNKVTCLTDSDTIVGVPFRMQGSRTARLASAPQLDAQNPDLATLELVPADLPAGALNSHYLKFTSGPRSGRWYDMPVGTNTASTVTIDLNGDNLNGVGTGDSVTVAEYWTLDTLFPPSGATATWTETPPESGNWVPGGHAIMASSNTLSTGRRTEVRMPDMASSGINRGSEGRYYIHAGIWKRSGSGNTEFGTLTIPPESLIKISHPSTVAHPTVFRSLGDVETGEADIPLSTRIDTAHDNYIAIPRPIEVSLNDLNLMQSGAFVESTNTLSTGRRDQLLVFDNEQQLRNKTASAIYFVHNGIWKRSGGGNTDRGDEITIPAGNGFIIRKYPTTTGETSFWNNTPAY